MTADFTVVVPAEPPVLNDRAARILLRILERAAADRNQSQEAPPAAAA